MTLSRATAATTATTCSLHTQQLLATILTRRCHPRRPTSPPPATCSVHRGSHRRTVARHPTSTDAQVTGQVLVPESQVVRQVVYASHYYDVASGVTVMDLLPTKHLAHSPSRR